MQGNHHYCFVDFETREEANAAMKALNGKFITEGSMEGKLKVALAGGMPDKLMSRTDARQGDRRRFDRDGPRQYESRSGNREQGSRSTASTDWRRRDDN